VAIHVKVPRNLQEDTHAVVTLDWLTLAIHVSRPVNSCIAVVIAPRDVELETEPSVSALIYLRQVR